MTGRTAAAVQTLEDNAKVPEGAFAMIAKASDVDQEVLAELRRSFAVPVGAIDLGPIVFPSAKAKDSAIVARRLQIGRHVVGMAVWLEG